VIYEKIRSELVESKFHTNNMIANVTEERTEIYEDKMKFMERIKSFSRQKEPWPLFLFRHAEHNTIQHLYRPSKGFGAIKFKNCEKFDDVDYGSFQLLVLAFYSEASLESVRCFCEQQSTHKQSNFKGGLEADTILITTAIVMISTCTRAYQTYMRKFLPSKESETRLHVGTLDYNLAAQICQDFLPALKEYGNSPILADGSLIEGVMKMPFLEEKMGQILSHEVIGSSTKKKLKNDDIEKKFNKDAVIDTMKKEWKVDLVFHSGLALSYLSYLDPRFYCQCLFLKKDKTKRGEEPTSFTNRCLDSWYGLSFLDDQNSICNWDHVPPCFLLKPSLFIKRACQATTPDGEDFMTPEELIIRFHGPGDGLKILNDDSFNYERVFHDVVKAWLLDKNVSLGLGELRNFYLAAPELSGREKFLQLAPEFYNLSCKRFCGTEVTQNRKFNELNLTNSSEKEKKRIKEMVVELNERVGQFINESNMGGKPYNTAVSGLDAPLDQMVVDHEHSGSDEEEKHPASFVCFEATENGSENDFESDDE